MRLNYEGHGVGYEGTENIVNDQRTFIQLPVESIIKGSHFSKPVANTFLAMTNATSQGEHPAPPPSSNTLPRKISPIKAPPDGTPGMNLSFAGCGFLGIYHVGVSACLRKYAPELLVERIAGASAGALAAACLLCDADLGKQTSHWCRGLGGGMPSV